MKYLFALLITSTLSFADIAIEPLALSYHYDRDKDYNENHKYIGLVYRYDMYEVGIGTMENSHYKRSNSVYVGMRPIIYTEGDLDIGMFVDVGYRTGYSRDLLIYGGLYTEYKDVYAKIAAGTNVVGFTVGYIFRTNK